MQTSNSKSLYDSMTGHYSVWSE